MRERELLLELKLVRGCAYWVRAPQRREDQAVDAKSRGPSRSDATKELWWTRVEVGEIAPGKRPLQKLIAKTFASDRTTSLPMAVELLARDARASVPCPRPSERVGLAQVARRASDPLAPRSAWSLAGNSRHAVGAACVLVLTSMSSAWPFHRKVRPLTAVAPCAARICMLSKAHMLISHRPPAPVRS